MMERLVLLVLKMEYILTIRGMVFAESSAWVSSDDGILAIDKNNDGIINNGSEIFGDSYIKGNEKKSKEWL